MLMLFLFINKKKPLASSFKVFFIFTDTNDLLFLGIITWKAILVFYSSNENESYST